MRNDMGGATALAGIGQAEFRTSDRVESLVRGNLIAALTHHVAVLCEAAPMGVALEVCGTPFPIAPAVEAQLLRITLEALDNAVRHSGAKRVAVDLSFDADALRLTVTDNGNGFERSQANLGRGLPDMYVRAAQIGAEFAIDSQRSRGTEIRVSVPLAAVY